MGVLRVLFSLFGSILKLSFTIILIGGVLGLAGVGLVSISDGGDLSDTNMDDVKPVVDAVSSLLENEDSEPAPSTEENNDTESESSEDDSGDTDSDNTDVESSEPPDYPPRISKEWDQELWPNEDDPHETTVKTSKGNELSSEVVERFAMEGINKYRTDNGLEAWEYSRYLASVSRAHSKDMHVRDFFAHTNPSDEEPWDRFESDEYCQSSYGENLVRTFVDQRTYDPYDNEVIYHTEEQVGQAIVEYWQQSPPHNELLLMKGHDAMGVGVYLDKNDEGGYVVEVTLNVCTFNENDPPEESLAD